MILSLLFFFKQKTEYEVRISDWSSDVCSSDLVADRLRPLGRPCFAAGKAVDRFILPEPGQRREDIGLTLGAKDGRAVGEVEMQVRRARLPGEAEEADHLPRLDPVEIGRASCRERVCK